MTNDINVYSVMEHKVFTSENAWTENGKAQNKADRAYLQPRSLSSEKEGGGGGGADRVGREGVKEREYSLFVFYALHARR